MKSHDLCRTQGITLLEIAFATALFSVIAFGVLGGIVIASGAQRSNLVELESRQLFDRVMEELQAVDFDGLLVFDGTFIVAGDHRADITVVQIEPALMQLQVDVTSTEFAYVTNVGTLLIADLD